MKTILIFEEAPEAVRQRLERKYPEFHFVYGDDPSWPDVLENARAIFGFIPDEYRNRLKSLPQLELVQLPFAGYEGWPELVNCPLANASGVFGLGISEYLIGAILSFYRQFPLFRKRQKEKIWDPEVGDAESIYGKTILVLGCGDLGSTFAKKVQELGAYTIGAATRIRKIPGFDRVITLDDLDGVLPECDIVVSTLPSNEKTRYLLNLQTFEKMKPTALFINVGRGDLVSLKTLEEVMERKLIAGMILDVFETEPLPQDSTLWENDAVMITPHISGDFSLPETRHRMWMLFESNLDALRDGKPFVNVVANASAGK